jgi:hypothetical protein
MTTYSTYSRIARVAAHQKRLLVWDVLAAIGLASAFAVLTAALF